MKWAYAINDEYASDLSLMSVDDWEKSLHRIYKQAISKTPPCDDGLYVFIPHKNFPETLLPRLKEFGFKLDF